MLGELPPQRKLAETVPLVGCLQALEQHALPQLDEETGLLAGSLLWGLGKQGLCVGGGEHGLSGSSAPAERGAPPPAAETGGCNQFRIEGPIRRRATGRSSAAPQAWASCGVGA